MANPYQFGLAKIAAKVEASPGVTETLAAADVILAENFVWSPKYGNSENAGMNGTFSKEPGASGTQAVEFSFDVNLKGSGTAGTAPNWRSAMMSCGMSETIVGGTSVTYAFASPESYFTYGFEVPGLGGAGEDLIFRATGCQCGWKFAWKGGELLKVSFNGMGVIVTAPADGTVLGAPTWDTTAPQVFLAPSLTVHGVASLPFETLEVDSGTELAMRPNANSATGLLTAQITGRRVKGSIDVEAMKLATFNPYTRITANTTGAISMSPIGAAGNRVDMDMPKVRITGSDHSARAGALVQKLAFEALRSANAGNDEISFILT